MSNHTNSDLYFNDLLINKHIVGRSDPILTTQKQYINDQKRVLEDNNLNLPPQNRYSFNIPSSPNILASTPGCSGSTVLPPVIGEKNGTYPPCNPDVYLRRAQNRYDPYNGYLYNKGLLIDGPQRRRITSTYVDINSKFRVKKPSLITETSMLLGQDPLEFTNGSHCVFIRHPNSGFEVNNSITIDGVYSKISILRTHSNGKPTFEIPVGYNFMKIRFCHGVPLNYDGNTIQVKLSDIKGDKGISRGAQFLGSIQTNILNTTHDFKLFLTQKDILCRMEDIIESTCDTKYFDPSPDYFFIVLPVIMRTPYILHDYNFKLKFESLAGIPVNLINANYPINNDHLTGYHIITSINEDGYTISLPIKAVINNNNNKLTSSFYGGGNCVYVSRVTEVLPGYPNSNQYTISLEDVFNNVIEVRLVSTEIPNTEYGIRNVPSKRTNNKLYWNNIDDGDFLYELSITPGNYCPDDFANVIDKTFETIPRIIGITPELKASLGVTYTEKHFSRTIINESTNEVIFRLYKEFIVNEPIISVVPQPPLNVNPADLSMTYKLTIRQPNHGMSTSGLQIIIKGAIDNLGIPYSVINGEHRVTKIIDQNKYIIELPIFNLLSTNTAETKGGINVLIYIPDLFRMRFDLPDTIGKPLGFRNVGDETSITPYETVVSNKELYEFEEELDSIGQSVVAINNCINLAGDNYIIMVANPIKTFKTLGKIKHAFAKIQLSNIPGLILYNTFVPMSHYFVDPLYKLFELDIAFYSPDGQLYDFNGRDQSFTLEIVTVDDVPGDTGIDANTGKNYNNFA